MASLLDPDDELLLDSIKQKESGGSKNGTKTIGDNGKAVGEYQMWKVAVKDVVAWYPKKYKGVTHHDVFHMDEVGQRDMALAYINVLRDKYKVPNTVIAIGRAWNGGPPVSWKKGIPPANAITYAKRLGNIYNTKFTRLIPW